MKSKIETNASIKFTSESLLISEIEIFPDAEFDFLTESELEILRSRNFPSTKNKSAVVVIRKY